MCINQCIHIDISEDLIELARKDERLIRQQKGVNNKSTIEMTSDNDFIGSLAQNIVFEYFEYIGIYIEKTSFFDEKIYQDECDYKYRGLCDVKGSPTEPGWDDVYPGTRFLISEHQLSKVVDWYVFVKVNIRARVAHIPGVISYSDFMRTARKIQTVEGFKFVSPCRFVLAKELFPFRRYVYAV